MGRLRAMLQLGLVGLTLTGLVLAATPVFAAYPERPIRIILGFPAGSGADIMCRWFSQKLSEVSGATVVIENKPGAAGNIASEAIATAKPDGYSILFGGAAGLAASPAIYKNLRFDTLKDIEPVTAVAELVFALSVHPQLPVKSVADLTAYLRNKGPKATYGWAVTSAIASTVLYLKEANLDVTQVTYKATGQAISDVAAQQVDFAFGDVMYVLGQQHAGKVRILATTGTRRPSAAPDIPTMQESGYQSVVVAPWWAVFVPAGVPREINDQLAAWFDKITAMPETKEFLKSQGGDPLIGDREYVRKRLVSDMDYWRNITKLANLTPQ
ncbi:MAG TPA: tripartite tricarboxylate transporter substrate binding protein [Beijerinckiaceae bacterium]|jgi:tripartite-type tricarboxylate transporter receptor subunit TctC|nr:tripartite tricarboxylate transporter substrate binding protein [Beijerinckiaceae bacterium]